MPSLGGVAAHRITGARPMFHVLGSGGLMFHVPVDRPARCPVFGGFWAKKLIVQPHAMHGHGASQPNLKLRLVEWRMLSRETLAKRLRAIGRLKVQHHLSSRRLPPDYHGPLHAPPSAAGTRCRRKGRQPTSWSYHPLTQSSKGKDCNIIF